MNSDQAYDQLPNTNYTFGKNIRITKNQLIGDETGDYSSVHEGIITPVYAGYKLPVSTITYQTMEDGTCRDGEYVIGFQKQEFDLDAVSIKVSWDCPYGDIAEWFYVGDDAGSTGTIKVYVGENLLENQQFVEFMQRDDFNNVWFFQQGTDGEVGTIIITTEETTEDTEWLKGQEILACDSVGNLGVIVTKEYKEDAWRLNIHRFKLEDDNITALDENFLHIEDSRIKNLTQVSVVLYKELDNVIKLYIATGIWPILTIRADESVTSNPNAADVNSLINNRILPTDPVYIQATISGALKTSQVQYTYRFYNKYGIATRLAPLTNKIQVIDSNRNKETGNAEDTTTSVGFSLQIKNTDKDEIKKFERLQIYRIQYIKENEDANVYLIYDGDKQSQFNDVGIDPLQELTMEEFASLSGIQIIPDVIEYNQDYMFAANVKDDTIIKDVKTEGGSISLVNTDIKISKKQGIYEMPSTSNDPFVTSGNTESVQVNASNGQYVAQFPKSVFQGKDSVTLRWASNDEDISWFYVSNTNNPDHALIVDTEEDLMYDQTFYDLVRDTQTQYVYFMQQAQEPQGSGTVKLVFPGQNISIYDESGNSLTSVQNYFEDRNVKSDQIYNTYNNIFTSSMLRSLRRGETYKYGIVYYDNIGRRSDVLKIDDIYIPEIDNTKQSKLFSKNNDTNEVYAHPIGVKITLPQPKDSNGLIPNIVGCQIVRRSSKDIYQKTLLQVALARPIRQGLKKTTDSAWTQSPYYPLGFLTTDYAITSGYYGWTSHSVEALYTRYEGVYGDSNTYGNILNNNQSLLQNSANSYENTGLFQIFSSEIDFRRDDVQNKLSANDCYLNLTCILYPDESVEDLNNITNKQLNPKDSLRGLIFKTHSQTNKPKSVFIPKREQVNDLYKTVLGQCDKISDHLVYGYNIYSNKQVAAEDRQYKLIDIKDVKIPKWYEGFSNIKYNGKYIEGGVKQYKSYTTSIDEYVFNNWVSFGLYDLQIYDEQQPNTFRDANDDDWGTAQYLYDEDPHEHAEIRGIGDSGTLTASYGNGFIGPGPSCLLVALDTDNLYDTNGSKYEFNDILNINDTRLGTYICNIQHDVSLMNAESDEVVQYFGFGNYFNLKLEGNKYKVVHNYKNTTDDYMIVFDGDIYITPHELTTEYKTYDFNSHDTLESMQVTNYVPMESKVNTFFDYGMNYLNTQSANLLYEAGSVEGIVTQDRPAHQYNMIYSMNDQSNDVFSLISTDKNETNNFPQRTYYSEPKINGEFIDNFNVFKAVSFIDVNSKYGEITNLLTNKNTLFYWQDTAFGKFSVNERSLINDQNGNTIMLGQAGILSRFDYINTKYGMRLYDFCATAAEDKVYWVDINNRAVVVGNANEAVNLGEQLNVQNIINKNIDVNKIPKTDYDLQNNEILFKCLKDNQQIVFNIKYNIATSIYNRDYSDIVYIDNHMYGINDKGLFTKYNYLSVEQNDCYLSPVQLSFVVNNAASTTKVFDSQQIVPIKRNEYSNSSAEDLEWFVGKFFDKDTTTEFETDILGVNNNTIEPHTDREGNIIYNVPRFGNNPWGNRMRGKWLRTSIDKEKPHEFFTISHVITKLRQSYS